MNWKDFDLPLRACDIMYSGSLDLAPDSPRIVERPLHIGFVCVGPGAGSGGHTTLFRVVKGLEDRGHVCTLFLYDKDSDDVSRHSATIRSHWPEIAAKVQSATPVIEGVDAVVASSWVTANVVASRTRGAIRRFYFIQDFEPYFYPRGELYTFAEDTYRFGFHNIALGQMVSERLLREVGIDAEDSVPFGCDTNTYRIDPPNGNARRNGVVFYARPNADRRGYLLGKLALERFYLSHPDQEIHVVGDRISGWSIPTTYHGTLTPSDLNSLFNRSIAGIALSFTNISLVAEEMLASGCIPVINKSSLAMADLPSTYASWAPATPTGIASALSRAVARTDVGEYARSAAASIRRGWSKPQSLVADAIEKACKS